MYCRIHCSNSSPILELSVKFASQMCHENINKLVDGAYLTDFGIDITINKHGAALLVSNFCTKVRWNFRGIHRFETAKKPYLRVFSL